MSVPPTGPKRGGRSRKGVFAPAKTGPPGPVPQRRVEPSPRLRSGQARWITAGVQPELFADPYGIGKGHPICGVPVRCRCPCKGRLQRAGRGVVRWEGVQPESAACAPAPKSSTLPHSIERDGNAVSFNSLCLKHSGVDTFQAGVPTQG